MAARKTGDLSSARLAREMRTMEAMVCIYCRAHHGPKPPCAECSQLLEYARARLAACPFGEMKPTCQQCPVHCYKPAMQDIIKKVMRFAGPRMLLKHPVLAIRHLLDERRSKKRGKK